MIIGLGSDIVNIDRITAQLQQNSDKFLNRIFTEFEITAAQKYTNKQSFNAHFAKRFAAKEAFAKAAGTGFGKYLNFKDIGVENNEQGKPQLKTNKKAEKLLQNLALKYSAKSPPVTCHISLSDDHPFALAVVILEITTTE